MAVYKQPKSKYWWYKFTWNGEPIRESTKQTNKRIAEQMEAAHRTALAKGEVGIRDKKPVPTLKDFAERDFLPFVRSTFTAKLKTQKYYEYGVKSLLAFERLATARLDSITTETIAAFVAVRKGAGVQISSINRELQALRRMFHLAQEWGKVEKALPTVRMVPGENHRERVLTSEEEALYFAGAKSEAMNQHMDASLLSDVASILLDCGLRPEECFRLRPENVRDGKIEIQYGKTDNARRRIPMTPRIQAILDMRLSKTAGGEWVFPAPTKSGHMEPSTLKKQHAKAIDQATAILRKQTQREDTEFQGFELYTLRHTCLTRWAPHMDPWTLAYLAGHRDMNITKRYVHPQEQTVRAAMDRAQVANSGHTSGHTGQQADLQTTPVLTPTI
ncbi:MAG TPA: tyrosine-type recombinase/integrase [Bryobacteraceae bacterium]|nr:tyrosine-type recombinase/integrase [Bryobacteraceae bacterium]